MRIGRSLDKISKAELGSSTELPRFGRRLEDDIIEHLVSFLQAVYKSHQVDQEKRASDDYSSSLPKFGRQVRSGVDLPKFGRQLRDIQQKRLATVQDDEEMGLSDELQKIGLLPLLKYSGAMNREDEEQGKAEGGWSAKRGVSMLRFGRANPTASDDNDDNLGEDSDVKRQSPLLRFGKRQSPLVRFGKRASLQETESLSSLAKRQAANILRFG